MIGSGQSLSVGTTPASLTTQPYNNLMLSLNEREGPRHGPRRRRRPRRQSLGPDGERPDDGSARRAGARAGDQLSEPLPGNIYGETPHAALANEITRFVKAASAGADYVTVHTIVGESGQGIPALIKQTPNTGGIGRAYAASLFEAGAINLQAKAAGKSYGVGVIVMTHGETDCNNTTYGDSLVQLLSDYNTDIAAITGQTLQDPDVHLAAARLPGRARPAPRAATCAPRPTTSSGSWAFNTRATSSAPAPSTSTRRTPTATASTST